MGLRLNRFLALTGVTSRRGADRLVLEGRVVVNGELVQSLGVRVDPATDRVMVDGRLVEVPGALFWGALHKPRGTLTTLHDPFGRPDLRGLLSDVPARVFPVGRLDSDSEGLLLITNDGELAYRLTHPRYQVEKEYWVEVRGVLPAGVARQLVEGVELEDGLARAVRGVVVERDAAGGVLRLTMTEGRKREVRRMVQVLGLSVERLVRIRVGSVELGELPVGRCRELLTDEVDALRGLVGLRVARTGIVNGSGPG